MLACNPLINDHWKNQNNIIKWTIYTQSRLYPNNIQIRILKFKTYSSVK